MSVYRSTNVDQAIADAQRVLAHHRADAATGCCVACGMTFPCPRVRAESGLLAAMGHAPSTPIHNGLLTYGWRQHFGETSHQRQVSAAMKAGRR